MSRELRPSIVLLGAAPELLSPGDAATLKAKLADAFIMRSVPVVHEGSIAIACGYEGITDFPPLEAIDHPIARLAHWA